MNIQPENHESPSFWIENIFAYLKDKFKEYRYVIVPSILLGLLSYLFIFTNKLGNTDELEFIFGKGFTLTSGRWGLEILERITPNYSMPWLLGCITIFLMTLSSCMIVHVFSIRKPVVQGLLSGLIMVFPSLMATFFFMFTTASYGFSFLCTIAALCLLKKGRWYHYLIALILTVISISIYQSYIFVLASLLVVLLIQQVMFSDASVRKVFLRGLCYIVFLIISVIVYFVLTEIINRRAGIVLGKYANDAVYLPQSYFQRIKDIYNEFWAMNAQCYKGLVHPGFSRTVHILALGFILTECVLWGIRSRKAPRILLLIFLLAILPLAILGIRLVSSPYSVHTLVFYSFIALYVLDAVLIDSGAVVFCKKSPADQLYRLACNLALLGFLLVIGSNVFAANEAALKMFMNHDNMLSVCSSMVADLHVLPGYTRSTPVALVGTYHYPQFYNEFGNLGNVQGIPVMAPEYNYFKYYCGYDIPMASEEELALLSENPQVSQMPDYPSDGSIQLIDGFAVIKLSDQ